VRQHARAFSSFLVVGAVCTALQYLILVLLVQIAAVGATLASSIGFAISSVLNYALNYRFTYRATTRHASSAPRFVVVNLAGLALNAAIVYAGVEMAGLHYVVAQVLATGIVLVWNFLVNLKWSFSNPTG
jgi:putative flippase GtrA